MNDVIRKDALRAINEAIDILKIGSGRSILDLKNLSNHTVHNASLFQDDASISVAVAIYSISKIIERKGSVDGCSKIVLLLEKLKANLEEHNETKFKATMKQLFSEIEKNDVRISSYTQEVLTKAHLKKACKLCEHGLSTARAAEIMGVSQWDTMNYLGKTTIPDHTEAITDVRRRLQYTRELFSKKTIVFDSGPIISLTMNNLLWLLEEIKKRTKARLIITERVKKELVDNPLNRTKRFMFEAMQTLKCIENGTLEVIKVDDAETNEILDIANNCYSGAGKSLRLVHPAEASAVALYYQVNADAIAIDERTTRLLIEDPKKLFNILKHNYRVKVTRNNDSIKEFHKRTHGMRVIRSVELVTVAFEKGMLDAYLADIPEARKRLLESVIWGVKLEGASVSKKELEQIMRLEAKRR